MVLEGHKPDTAPIPIANDDTGDIHVTPSEQLRFDAQKNQATKPSRAIEDAGTNSDLDDTKPPYDYRYVSEPTVDLSTNQEEHIADPDINLSQLDQVNHSDESPLERTQAMRPINERKLARIEREEKRAQVIEMVKVLEKQLRDHGSKLEMPVTELGKTSHLTVIFNQSRNMADGGMMEYAFTFLSDSGAQVERVVRLEWVEEVGVLVHEPDAEEIESGVVSEIQETPIELHSSDLQEFLYQILVMK